ncbi:BCAM0308 family protein [Pseudomonas sp. KCJK9016]|uniref:BCAM0308 family protein n=1 Tax=Pseudomonas sp. KCJK9016 TaxID=3344556 RepID=UPI003906CF4E
MDKFQQSQKNKLFKNASHDPYSAPHTEGPAVCPKCEAVYTAGTWSWKRQENTVVHGAQTLICPACRRIEDNRPAGILTLSGGYLHLHRGEIVQLIKHTEEKEKAEHPLERIIKLDDAADDLVVTTTGIHLANRLGHALKGAFKGNSEYRYSDSEYGMSVRWSREE